MSKSIKATDYLNIANHYIDADEFLKAIAILRACLRINPGPNEKFRALDSMGDCFLFLRSYKAALIHYKYALKRGYELLELSQNIEDKNFAENNIHNISHAIKYITENNANLSSDLVGQAVDSCQIYSLVE